MPNHPNRSKHQHTMTQTAKPQHTPLLPLSERGAWCQSYPREADKLIEELLAALKEIAALEEHAAGVMGLVDNPHIKALRVAATKARAVITKAEGR